MHKGIKPSSQPRSIRSIAETNDGKNFPAVVEEDRPVYQDAAEQARPQGNRGVSSGDKNPFNGLRGGK